MDSVYAPLADRWKQGVGSAAATDHLLTVMAQHPELAAHLDASELIPHVARNKYALDVASAGTDWLRPDVQNLREIFGQGPGWWQRLIDARASGVSLPSLVLPAVAIPYLASRDDGR